MDLMKQRTPMSGSGGLVAVGEGRGGGGNVGKVFWYCGGCQLDETGEGRRRNRGCGEVNWGCDGEGTWEKTT